MDSKFWYVYILQSIDQSQHYYVGLTKDLENRLKIHNSGKCSHTGKFRPWQIETAIAFRAKCKAISFEAYLKSHSGRAFAKKHF